MKHGGIFDAQLVEPVHATQSAPLEEIGSQKSLNRKSPGIATCHPEEVHDYLDPLTEQAALLLESEGLSEDDLKHVPLYLFATAGEEEGVFGWLTVNYLKNTFSGISTYSTVGALDLGGASTQITFQPPSSQPILQGLFPLRITEDLHANLYTHSYLYLGLTEAQHQHHQRLFSAMDQTSGGPGGAPISVLDPCSPSGDNALNEQHTEYLVNKQGKRVPVWIVGTSNATGCKATVEGLLRSLKLSSDQCLHHDHTDCALLGVYQPPASGPSAVEMYGFSGFVYTWQFFGMEDMAQADLQALDTAASTVCSKDIVALKKYNANLTHPQQTNYLDTFCFSANYITALLSIGYGMDRVNTPLQVVSTINGSSVSYAYGAMLYE
eukprot:gene13010-15372_t